MGRTRTAIAASIIALGTLAAVSAHAAPPPSAATTQDGFDICTTPSDATMRAWASDSVFTAVGVYIGGVNRGCDHRHLTPGWVDAQLDAGWSILPIYMGRQSWCSWRPGVTITPGSATSQGVAAGRDAATIMRGLGMGPGSPVYLDMEPYPPEASCDQAVFRYLDGWVAELHRQGYRAGFYGSALSPIAQVAQQYPPGSPNRPDDLWIARWNGIRSDDEEVVDPTHWVDRRIKQYRGGHDETHGGVTMHVDSNFVNGSVARRLITGPAAVPAPFATWEGFAAQQQADFQGPTFTLQARTSSVRTLAAGDADPDAYTELLLHSGWYEPHVAPVARLYWAYFGRIPDLGGVRYWTDRHRLGVRLGTISQQFATSSEFTRRTGGLDDEGVVRRIYTHVLGRPPDPSGLAYWTGRLRARTITRGNLMVQFSESTEYRRRTADQVNGFLVIAGMLGRAPTAGELATPVPLRDRITQVRTTAEYAARVQ